MRDVTVRDIVNQALNGREVFYADNRHVQIKRNKNGEIRAYYDAMPGYAVPSVRDRGFTVTEAMMDMTENDMPHDMRFIFWGVVLKELGLPEDGKVE